jgi:endonuclease YncB( thermonuclease family)
MKLFFVLLIVLLFPALAAAENLAGRVVKVVGDTVYVVDANRQQHKIRLSGIDAPERKQPFGTKSKQHLSGLVAGATVKVEWSKRYL